MDYLRLLESIRAKYARCLSYSDSGLALVPQFGRKMTEVTFQTFFCRPHKFRFDWIFENGEHRAAWSNGSASYYQRNEKSIELMPDLSCAMACATGTSLGCSDLIGPLLLTKLRLSSRSLLELPDLNMVEDEDAHFFFLTGSGIENNDTRVWISKKDYSIRRVEQDSYSLKTEREAKQQEFRAREERLSAILHREIQSMDDTDFEEDVHLLHDYKFTTVEFDVRIDPTVFEL